jgi:hypothetical protein
MDFHIFFVAIAFVFIAYCVRTQRMRPFEAVAVTVHTAFVLTFIYLYGYLALTATNPETVPGCYVAIGLLLFVWIVPIAYNWRYRAWPRLSRPPV